MVHLSATRLMVSSTNRSSSGVERTPCGELNTARCRAFVLLRIDAAIGHRGVTMERFGAYFPAESTAASLHSITVKQQRRADESFEQHDSRHRRVVGYRSRSCNGARCAR